MRNVIRAVIIALVFAFAVPVAAQDVEGEQAEPLTAREIVNEILANPEQAELDNLVVSVLPYLLKKASGGHSRSEALLGTLYFLGLGVPQDHAAASKWWGRSYEHSDNPEPDTGASGMRRRLKRHFNKKNFYNSDKLFPNNSEALSSMTNAAEQGVSTSQYGLGFIYSLGLGISPDYSEATKWWRKSAEQNHADAQYILGLMYIEGLGVPQHYVRAHMWLSLAAAQGVEPAFEIRDELARIHMSHAQVAEAQNLAVEWPSK
jgi:uncharacterized protein